MSLIARSGVSLLQRRSANLQERNTLDSAVIPQWQDLTISQVKYGHLDHTPIAAKNKGIAVGTRSAKGIVMRTQIDTRTAIIDLSGLRSEFSPDGYARWEGKVRLEFVDGGEQIAVVTANWSADEDQSQYGELVDFEGDSDDASLYAACEAYAAEIAEEISAVLPRPSSFEAHQNDLARRKAQGLPPFECRAA